MIDYESPDLQIIDESTPPHALAWLENLTIAFIPLALGYWFKPSDPLFVQGEFPWLILVPLLIGLRYGFAHGFFNAIVMITLIILASRFHYLQSAPFPAEIITGILLVGMISGEFRDAWNRRQRAILLKYQFHKIRQDELVRAYQLLKASHTDMENQLAGSPTSLRLLLVQLREQLLQIAQMKTAQPLAEVGRHMLHLLSIHCRVHIAAFYSIIKNTQLSLITSLGTPPNYPLNALENNPLVIEAIKTGTTTYLKLDCQPTDSSVLAVILLKDVKGQPHGLIVIYDMPLSAFHADNFALITLLGGHFGDILMEWANFNEINATARELFQLGLQRRIIDIQLTHIPSSLVVLVFKSQYAKEQVTEIVASQSRRLDFHWITQNYYGHTVFLKLMTLANQIEAQAFVHRIEVKFQHSHELNSTQLDIDSYIKELNSKDNAEGILTRLEADYQIISGETPDAKLTNIL